MGKPKLAAALVRRLGVPPPCFNMRFTTFRAFPEGKTLDGARFKRLDTILQKLTGDPDLKASAFLARLKKACNDITVSDK